MRFVLLSQYFWPEVGATQVRLAALCKELIREGHEVDVVTAMPHHPAGKIFPRYRGRAFLREDHGGSRIHRVWLWAGTSGKFARIVSYLSFALTSLFGLAHVRRPDYLFVESPPPLLAISGWIAAKLWGCPLVLNLADLWPDSARDLGILNGGPVMWLAEKLERWAYAHADWITVLAEGTRETLILEKNVAPEKVLFLPNGVDIQLFRPAAQSRPLKKRLRLADRRVVVYAGNHGYAAALEQIIEAARELSDRPEIHFLLIGDGPEKSRLQLMAKDWGLTNVTFHDAVPLEDLPRYLSIADCALVTLRNARVTCRTRSAKTFVMMAAGKPIVLAGEGETAQLVEQARAGLVVAPHAPRALAEAVRTMLDETTLAGEMGRNGRKFVAENLEWSVLVKNWLRQLTGSGDGLTLQSRPSEPANTPPASRTAAYFGRLALVAALAGALLLGVPAAAQTQSMILTWCVNRPEWNQKLDVSGIRAGCSDPPSSCVQDAANIKSSEGISRVFLAVRLNPSSPDYAGQYSELSLKQPAVYEVGIDDFVGQSEKLNMNPARLSAFLCGVIAKLKSRNPNLNFGITVYDDELTRALPALGLSNDFLQSVDFVHLFPHYRKREQTAAESVRQAKSIFPHARIISGVYTYDRRSYLPCSRGGVACSAEEEMSLFEEDVREKAGLLAQGAIAGIEFYPGFFGNEE
ncbi:MAG: glycosyltransferase family 4 protein, partial [Candidatus Acidiferrales bacterium]